MSSLSSPVARSLDTALADPAAVFNMSPARLSEALSASLKHLSPEAAQEISDVLSLSAPTPGKEAQLRVEKPELPTTALTFPETALSKQFQLSVIDKTKTVDGVMTGTLEVQYVIPANIDHPTARADVIKACMAREDRPLPAIWPGDLEWYKSQASEKSDNPAIERVVKYTIDFDSKDTGDGKMNMAGHRAYAEERNAHITPVELQALGAALYYEKTGLDLMKNYWVRAVVSYDGSAPGVALSTLPAYGVNVFRHRDGLAEVILVAALSPN